MNKLAMTSIVLFVLVELLLIFAVNKGPFFDEAIYNVAGMRALVGQGQNDGYLQWFSGSLVWPVIGGSAYIVGGLALSRVFSLLFALVSCLSVVGATKNLVGRAAAGWTAVAIVSFAPFLALAKLAVLDLGAMMGFCVALYAASQLIVSNNRLWILLLATAFSFGVLSKYPITLQGLLLLGILFYYRREYFITDMVLFIMCAVPILMGTLLPVRDQMSNWWNWASTNRPTFGSNRSMILYAQVTFMGYPLLLALLGAYVLKGRRVLAVFLFLAGLLWPLYHIVSGNPVSDWKHDTLGFLYLAPLIGGLWWKLSRTTYGKLVLVPLLLVWAFISWQQFAQFERSWPDVTPGAEYLLHNVQTDDHLLIGSSWSYTMSLIGANVIESPWAVFDAYRMSHGANEHGVCEYEWFVDETGGSYPWSDEIRQAAALCDFEPMFTFQSEMTGLGSDYYYHTVPVITTIYYNRKLKLTP
ncbi:MAG: hypothetical protein M3Q81_00105 [bacterium]|nr:hypothetical protein [bacterium]